MTSTSQCKKTWEIYQRMITAYRAPDRSQGQHLMRNLIDSLSHGVPGVLTELIERHATNR